MKCSNCNKPVVKFKKLTESATIPTYAHESDSGMDLYSDQYRILAPKSRALISTGLSMVLPEGYEGQIRPRSGLANQCGITVLNSPGTIDCGYRGEIKVLLINHSTLDFQINKGLRIAQLVIAPIKQAQIEVIEDADELPKSDRGTNGWGSTGA